MIDNAYVIGGGITGIAAALHLSEFKNINIKIFEKTSSLGGTLRDISDEDDNVFFKDTQYINKDSPLLSYIDPSLFLNSSKYMAPTPLLMVKILQQEAFQALFSLVIIY